MDCTMAIKAESLSCDVMCARVRAARLHEHTCVIWVGSCTLMLLGGYASIRSLCRFSPILLGGNRRAAHVGWQAVFLVMIMVDVVGSLRAFACKSAILH